MSKYTPGPWTVDATNTMGAYGVWAEYPLNPSGMPQVCSVFRNNKSDFLRETRDANAKLIAAAPELLEALRGLMISYESYMATNKPESEWDEYDQMVMPQWLKAKELIERLDG